MKREMIHMSNLRFQKLSGSARSAMVPFAIAAMWAAGACPGLAQQSAQQSAQPSAQVSAQQTFTSAADAGKSLFQAVQSNNSVTIVNILGGPTELASSGDEPQDKLDRECFVQKYQQMHRMVREANGTVMLYIGAENWPFPIPLVEKNGSWRFDSDAGMKEVLYRRIGENELTAIATCRDFAAQTQAGVKPKATGAQDFPASLVARAASDAGAATPILFHGYYFQVLPLRSTKTTGGFALIAYPAEYRSSGVMTFVVAAKDVVYEKDFGANTSALASAIKAFHKDATWHAANE